MCGQGLRGGLCSGAVSGWELTRKVSMSKSTVHNWEVEVEQHVVNHLP